MPVNDAAFQPLRLGELSPEVRPIEIVRDGKPAMVMGYVAGRRCPLHVTVEVNAAFARRDAAAIVLNAEAASPGSVEPEAYATALREVDLAMLDVLKAVTRGFDDGELAVMAGDYQARGQVLRFLGWLQPLPEDDADPEVEGEGANKTTRASSRRSRRSTARATGSP